MGARRTDVYKRQVVAGREHACGNATRDAAIPDAHVLVRIGVVRGVVISSRLGCGSERNAAIRRVHHQGSLASGDDFGAGVEPNLVVAADVARLGRPIDTIRRGLLFELRSLFGTQNRFASEFVWPLEWSDRRIGPGALKVRLAIGRLGDVYKRQV